MVFGVGTVLSVSAAILVQTWETSNRQARFQQRISNLTTTLTRNVERYTEVLYGLQDLYHSVPASITQAEFEQFTRRPVATYPGIQALEWAPRVLQTNRLQFERAARAQNPGFQIREPGKLGNLVAAAVRSEYVPVLFIQPWAGNEVALGFDLASDLNRRLAMQKAKDSGGMAVTNRIRLVQERKDQFGFLVFLPVYQNGAVPESVEARRTALAGYVLGVFRVSDVIEESLQGVTTDIDFAVHDVMAQADRRFLGLYQAAVQTVTTDPQLDIKAAANPLCARAELCSRSLRVGDREWQIRFQPADIEAESVLPVMTLITGLLLTGILMIYLRTALLELERTQHMSELKLQFFSMASHEFRTPLSTVLLSAQSLESNYAELSDQQKLNSIHRIQTSAKRMSQQLSDLLTLTRAEAGKLEFSPEITNLEQFCLRIIEEMQAGTAPSRILFTSSGSCSKAYVDKNLLYSVLTNLLSNAFKYSHEHPVDFSLICNDETATFQIRDQGIGIPVEDQDKIIDRFYRASNVGQTAGTGLGLTVAKTCLDLHGGQLTVESKVGEGTTFTVFLPMNTHL